MRFLGLLSLIILTFVGNGAKAQQISVQNVCVLAVLTTNSANAFTGVNLQNSCNYPVFNYLCLVGGVGGSTNCTFSDSVFNNTAPLLVNGQSILVDAFPPTVPNKGAPPIGAFQFECPAGSTVVIDESFNSSSGAPPCTTVTTSNIAASALPFAFGAQTGTTATVFANIVNAQSNTLLNCRVAVAKPAPAGLTFTFQQTDPNTNAPIGQPNTPVSIAGSGSATFVLSFKSSSPLVMPNLPLVYSCDGNVYPTSLPGISSVDVNISSSPIANIVAEAAVSSGNGILTVPVNSAGAFAVATENAGNASGAVTVTVDTGGVSLPVAIGICQTNPANGACLSSPSSSISLTIAQGAAPTFSVFATVSGPIALNPATNRIFVRYKVGGNEVGATSVAIQS